jgi:ribosomal protein L29
LEDIAQSERDWATLCVKLHLMQLVSPKQLSRLEKNIARAEFEEAVPSMERAAHALN